MVKEINYINIREILSRITRHPLLQEVNLEQVIQYTLDFIELFGYSNIFKDKEVELHIEDFKALLPCDLISINQVKDCRTKICLRSMTDTFKPDENRELTFKTQGRILYTSFRQGDILVSYKAIPVDDEGLPLLIDNTVYLRTLEAYIKKEVFTILFDLNKISAGVLDNAQRDYSWKAGQLHSEFTIPSISEMESIKNFWCSLIQNNNHFYGGFKTLGNYEEIKQH